VADSTTDIINKLIGRLDSVPDAFVESVGKVQNEVFKETLKLVNQMDTTDGLFVYNEKNLNIINQLNKSLTKSVYNDEFTGALTDFMKEFSVQATYNNDLFRLTIEDFELKDVYKQTLFNSQSTAIDLYSEANFTSEITTPLKTVLNSAVTQSMSFSDVQETIKTAILGNDKLDGNLVRYAKTTAYDAFAVADRTYYQAVATDYSPVWYKYVGKEIEDTRCFCQERKGRIYHVDNIRDWGRGKDLGECRSGSLWQGANKNTDESTIFNYVGGYNCKHRLMVVSLSSVSEADLKNAINKGYFKPKK
jgi:hypothetical protein